MLKRLFANYLALIRLSRRRLDSEAAYRDFQSCQARLLSDYFASKGVEFAGRLLLDLGSGIEGYSREFAGAGTSVISLDLTPPRQALAARQTRLRASAIALPLEAETIDIVFCASLIEHVAEPEIVLAEAYRVLKPNGIGYFSFPPYYSPMGGHEFAPFHYFGEKTAMRLAPRHQRVVPDWVRSVYPVMDSPQSFSNLYQGWGLYKMTVRKFRDLVSHSGFSCLDLSTRYLPCSFVHWPLVGELLTWHAQFLLIKRSK